ncbi:MAG: acetolactate synthase small subunit [Actinobacteria bacterium]|nr:acetolactate synthase small subunit [Actinomycetota bacterium]
MSPATRHHILSVLVENKPGVLARVSGLFARRGFNIFSLAVAPTDDATRSRITIVVDVESAPLEQITKQLDKLINVLQIDELAPSDAVERELMIVTVTVTPESKPAVLLLTDEYSGAVLDEAGDRITVSLGGTPEALDAFTSQMGTAVVAYQRTGRIALPRITS